MHIEDAVRSRRAIKGYDSSFSLTREEKDHLLDLALHAPSAFNLQHVRLVEVSDPQLRTQLREVAWDQAQVTDAAMLVVVCAQLDSWERNAQRVWDGAPEAVQAFMAGAIDTYYRGKPQVQRDEAMRSCGIAGADPDAGRPRPGPGFVSDGWFRLRCRGPADQPAGQPCDRPDGRGREKGR